MNRCTSFLFLLSFLIPRNTTVPLNTKVNWQSFDWRVIKTDSFNIHYPKGYENLGKIAALYAEEANILISDQLQHTLLQVIPVFIYPSHIYFQHTNIVPFPLSEGIGGFTDVLKRRVVLPFLGSYDEFRHVLTHELVHAFQYDILYGTKIPFSLFGPPLWLIEGMAEYLSTGWEETGELFARDAIYTDTLPSIEELTSQRVRSGYAIYKGGQSVMFFIDQVYGMHKISELMHDIRDYSNLNDAIESTFHITLKEFDQKWRIWLKRQYANIIHKKLLEEELLLITQHEEDGSYLNLKPSISPDGQHVAYLSIRNFLPAIILKETNAYKKKIPLKNQNSERILKKSKREETILVQGGDNNAFHQLHLRDNRISFSPDSKKILFATKSQGKDFLCFFDIAKKEVIKKWAPALDVIKTPQLSPDGTKVVMVGVVSGQPDIYYFDLKTETLLQLTFNLFSEKDPTLNMDNTRLLFSSNHNSHNNFEESNYHIFEITLNDKKTMKQITFAKGKQRSPQYYYKNKNHRIFYTSTQNGTSNLFLKDIGDTSTYQITDLISGVFNPTIDQKAKKFLFGAFSKQGYDIAITEAPQSPDEVKLPEKSKLLFKQHKYPIYSQGLSRFTNEPYKAYLEPDYFFVTLFYDNLNGVAGAIYGSATDYLGNHNVSAYFDYLTVSSGFNLYVNYGYLKERADFYLGVYRELSHLSPYRLFSNIDNFNLLLKNIYRLTQNYTSYGFHFTTIYPLTSFWFSEFRLQYSRHDETFERLRSSIFTNLNQLLGGIVYNNVLYSIFGPIQGQLFQYQVEQSINLSGNDFVFNRQIIEYRGYYNFFTRYVIAFKAFVSTTLGPQAEFFPDFIGGFATLRGYPILSFHGTNTFLASLEFRFPVLDALLLGFPVQWVFPGFSGVFFADFGTTFYDINAFRGFNSTEGTLQDLKLTIGFGIRILIVPGVYIKFDWGAPWNLKEIGSLETIFSIGTNF